MILKFDYKPLSHNQAYRAATVGFGKGGRATIAKTTKYKNFEKKLRLDRPTKVIRELEKCYDPAKYGIVVVLDVYLKDMMTKPKNKSDVPRLSKSSFDCGNGYKACIDALFGDTKINDAYIVSYTENKHQNSEKKDYFTIDIKVVEL